MPTSASEPADLKHVVHHYYLFNAFIALVLWLPIFYAYQIKMGLSDHEYFNIQSLYYLFMCLLEIPTGFIADRWGYRLSLKGAAFFMLLTNISAILWTSYLGFLTHFALIALGRALTSGAASAYLYDYLKKNQLAGEYKRIEGSARAYSLYARIVGWVAAGFMFEWQPSSPYLLTAIGCAIALYSACCLPNSENQSKSSSSFTAEMGRSLKAIGREFAASRSLRWVMFIGLGVFILVRLSQVNLYQPLLTAKGFTPESFGWIVALMTAFEAFGAKRAHRLSAVYEDLKVIHLATFGIALSLIAITFSGQIFTILFFITFSLFSGVAFPLIRQTLNDVISNDRYRATLLSVESIIHRAFTGVAAALAGWAVGHQQMYLFLQILSIVAVFLMALAITRLRKSLV